MSEGATSGRDDFGVGDVRYANPQSQVGGQWGQGQQGQFNNQGFQSQQLAPHHSDLGLGQGHIESHRERLPVDAANWSQNQQFQQPQQFQSQQFQSQPPFAEGSVVGAIPTDYAHSDATLQVPVVQTTTVSEVKQVDIPVQTVPLEKPFEQFREERSAPFEQFREERSVPLEQFREREMPIERQAPLPPPPVQPVAVCAPASNDVFREAASKAPEFISRIENREREVMRVHEKAEFEIKKEELKHKKEEMKHEALAEKKLQESEWHREMVYHHGDKLEEKQDKLISEPEMLRRAVLQLTEEMQREHNAYMQKLEGLKNLIIQRTQDIKFEQRDQLQEQSRHHEMMLRHEAEIDQARAEAEEHARMAEYERQKKEEARLLAESQKELKEEHKDNVDDARHMPGGSGVVGGIRDVAHKAKVALGL
jgi:hypothetical protein